MDALIALLTLALYPVIILIQSIPDVILYFALVWLGYGVYKVIQLIRRRL